ncbi:MAG: bacillithiol system redox-active protein YtxJ [Flavobacteriales bacterium]|nr:bacillithiol system redox-active protein YtxJ [Flavobacteriales bacterium]
MSFGFFGNKTSRPEPSSIWSNLLSLGDLEQLMQDSFDIPQLIFKHSTRCGVSRMVLRQFESEWGSEQKGNLYLLDLIEYRDISNRIEELTGIIHQSPQVIVILKGEAIDDASHHSISAPRLEKNMKV